MMRTIYQHITDPSITLHEGDSLRDTRVVQGGTAVGRVLFARSPAVEVTGRSATIAGCEFISAGVAREGRRG